MDKNSAFFKNFNNSPLKKRFEQNPIAYFCAEFALTNDIPIYAGGLGILAGDFIKEASDQSFPVVAVGLYYNDGYETLHKVDQKGYIDQPHVHSRPENYGLTPLVDENQNRVMVTVPIQDGIIKIQAWVWHVGKVPVYLLDTNVEENSPNDRKITDHLYVIDKETRIKQEVVLGIGGARILEKLNINPSLYHMNEGHSGFLALEVIKHEMKNHNVGFNEAKEFSSEKIVFTNHTLVIAGHDVFATDLVSLTLSGYANELGVPVSEIVKQGTIEDTNEFSMTTLCLRLSGKINAVSHIHAKKASEIWPNYSMIPITNGVHLPSWNEIYSEDTFWEGHLENKRELLQKIELVSGISWPENTFIIGWARRLVSYKRPLALFEDVKRLAAICKNSEKPVRIVFSGTLHPSDTHGVEILGNIRKLLETDLKGLAVYLPGYDIKLAKLMTAGSDVWLNTPIVGFEACGTSGMKAGLNGVLPLSTRDGWMDEVEFLDIGWPLDNDNIANSILDTIEQKVLPLYYNRDENGKPVTWIKNMQNCRKLIMNEYSATRMLSEYIEKFYSEPSKQD